MVLDNEFMELEKNMDFENPNLELTYNAYYNHTYTESTFIEKSKESLESLKLIGSAPTGKNDIAIYKVLADYLLINGTIILDSDSKGNLIQKTWYPKDYNDLVNSHKKILLTNGNFKNSKKYYVVITGIIDEDLSKFEVLKTIDRTKAEHEQKSLLDEFSNKYMPLLNLRIVSDSFYKDTVIDKNNILDNNLFDLTYAYNNEKYYTSFSSSLISSVEMNIYDGKNTKKISDIKEDEIVLDMALISKMNGGDKFYSEQLEIYTKKIDKEYEDKLKQREKKLEEELKKAMDDPEYVIKDIPEVAKLDESKILDDFNKKFINDFGIIGKTINVTINDLYKENNYKSYDLKVIGYVYGNNGNNSDKSLVNEKIISEYMRGNRETYKININEKEEDKIKDLLVKYSDDKNFNITTLYSSTIKSLKTSVNKLSGLFKKISYGLIGFSIVLLTLYILMSINNSKKEIGILRSLGTKISGIYKIFYIEGLIIGVISIILSSILIYFGTGFINNYISKDLFYSVKPIVFNPVVILYISVIIFVVVSISSLIPLIKISKNKVIDIIYDK